MTLYICLYIYTSVARHALLCQTVDLFSDIFLDIQLLLFFLFDAYTNKLESPRIKFVIPTFQLYATHVPPKSPQGPHSAYNILRSMGEIHCERD